MVSGVVVYNVRVVFENCMRLFLITKQLNRAEQFWKPSSLSVCVCVVYIHLHGFQLNFTQHTSWFRAWTVVDIDFWMVILYKIRFKICDGHKLIAGNTYTTTINRVLNHYLDTLMAIVCAEGMGESLLVFWLTADTFFSPAIELNFGVHCVQCHSLSGTGFCKQKDFDSRVLYFAPRRRTFPSHSVD